MSKKSCPFCYKEYKVSELTIFCIKCNNESPKSKLKISDKLSLKAGLLPKIDYCPTCGKTKGSNIIYKCPSCNNELFRDIIELKNKTISIVGGRGSGKTTYITLLIDELKKNIKLGDGRTFRLYSNDSREADIISKLQDRIKIAKKMPDATEPRELKSDDSTAGIPLTYFYKANDYTIALSFYDSAGEDLQNFDAFQREYGYISNSSGIIFIMDVFSGISNLRNSEYVLNNLIKLIKLDKGISINSKISTPISITLNKFDLYRDLEDRNIKWNGNNDESIMEQINNTHQTILNHFRQTDIENLGNLLQICEENFSTYRIIPVSSLGFDPLTSVKAPEEIKPFDIEYPYIYLLKNT